MGNRGVITTEDKRIGVYLHWNGGRDSVEAFLTYCDIKGYRPPECDCYGWARLCQVIGNYFGGILSVGIDLYERLDKENGDNGVYIIKNWGIVGREFFEGHEQDEYKIKDMLNDIDKCQPTSEQLGEEKIKTYLVEKGIIRICPKCKKEYSGYPAISRRDNRTEICSDCGVAEAFEDFIDKGE